MTNEDNCWRDEQPSRPSSRHRGHWRAAHYHDPRIKQAEFQIRPCVVHGAPHYWLSDPIDEPGSHSGFVAPRRLRFLAERL